MNKLIVSPSPHIHSKTSTSSLMRDVVIAMLPAVLVSVLFYGWAELEVLLVSVVSCVGLEYLITRFMLKRPNTICDWSAAVTGVLLALNVPSTCPWWIIFTGAVIAIGVAKLTFGGLGQNLFNPAITARVFLLISFPTQMTAWSAPKAGLSLSQVISHAWTGTDFGPDAFTGATPLGLAKEGGSVHMDYLNSLFFNIGGSVGEISALALILGFAYLLVRRVIRPHITLSIWATVIIFSGIFWLINPDKFTDPVFNMLTGGMLLGSIFMATDYVTSPMSPKGGIVFGVGIGLLTMIIRYFGSYPEGMSFSILIMNATVPLLNGWFKSKKFGRA
ncbi:MAG: RnfABCDGE type electron transport complex subunit D [Bacteroidales bacterium]|nr:RnfABCDGE type electron transport complex subunit D [Bacteroidales bacterium]